MAKYFKSYSAIFRKYMNYLSKKTLKEKLVRLKQRSIMCLEVIYIYFKQKKKKIEENREYVKLPNFIKSQV